MKKNLIIGTAGHIDHGKTTLIRALTGEDTDRLSEEKDRGISIELGFTNLELNEKLQLGIIDVPGHEKFVKNMLAGAGGVDLALLVIAADEGVMEQTREHLAILDLLNVEHGLVALTKQDKVEDEWLELVIEDTKEKLENTFLEDAPIVPVSGVEQKGLDKLKDEIKKIVENIPAKDTEDNVYYPIDRVFTISGHGTIVTGTLVSGKIEVEDRLTIYPDEKEIRVRSLQVHNQKTDEAHPGQRVGINLAGIDKEELDRGDVLATPDSLPVSNFVDGNLKVLEDAPLVIEHGERIRFHIGAREVLGRVYMIDKEQLLPGEEGLVQYRLEEKIVARYKENYVVRRYSPMTTIGGGVVLDNNPPYRKKQDLQAIEELEIKRDGSPEERVKLALRLNNENAVKAQHISRETNISLKKVKDLLQKLNIKDDIICFEAGEEFSWLEKGVYQDLVEQLINQVEKYHQKYPLRKGLQKEELRTSLAVNLDKNKFDELIGWLESDDQIKIDGPYIAKKGFEVKFRGKAQEVKNIIIDKVKNNFMPPDISELQKKLDFADQLILEVVNALKESNELIKVDHELYFHPKVVENAKTLLLNYLRENGEIELAEFRDIIESSRKYALPLLKYFDSQGITKREGDKRVLKNN